MPLHICTALHFILSASLNTRFNSCHYANHSAVSKHKERGLSPSSLSLSHNPMWWQTPERSPLLVIELTSFSKYQEPCWIIKMCLCLGTYFWQKLNRAVHRKQSCACWMSRKKETVLFFIPLLLLWLKLSLPPALTTGGERPCIEPGSWGP